MAAQVKSKDLYVVIESNLTTYAQLIRDDLIKEICETLPGARLKSGARVLDVSDVCEWLELKYKKRP